MDTSSRLFVMVLVVGATFIVVPVIAWTVWLHRARPRPRGLLVVAIAVTMPILLVTVGAASAMIQLRAADPSDGQGPSERAHILAETISETMNATAVAVIVAAGISVCVIAASRWRRRDRRL